MIHILSLNESCVRLESFICKSVHFRTIGILCPWLTRLEWTHFSGAAYKGASISMSHQRISRSEWCNIQSGILMSRQSPRSLRAAISRLQYLQFQSITQLPCLPPPIFCTVWIHIARHVQINSSVRTTVEKGRSV